MSNLREALSLMDEEFQAFIGSKTRLTRELPEDSMQVPWPVRNFVRRVRAALTGDSPSPAEATERPDLRAALGGIANMAHLAWTSPDTIREAFEWIENTARAALTGDSPSEPLTDNQRAGIAQQALLGGAAPEEEREP